MQLNPARGRKRAEVYVLFQLSLGVYAAQPREGTETCPLRSRHMELTTAWFMQLNPARGRKL